MYPLARSGLIRRPVALVLACAHLGAGLVRSVLSTQARKSSLQDEGKP